MSQDQNNINNNNSASSKKPGSNNIANSAAARGYVATQNSLNGLLNDLLGTVKGIRKQQKEQEEKIEELTKQVEEQKIELERLRRSTSTTTTTNNKNNSKNELQAPPPPSPPGSTASSNNTNPQNSTISSNDLAQFRRELIGIIGEALAQHEEEHHVDDDVDGQNNNAAAAAPPPPSSTTVPSLPLKLWEEFCSNLFPRHLTRTFHSNGATVLNGSSSSSHPSCGYIDYPMAMISMMPSFNRDNNQQQQQQPKQKSIFSWSFQTQGNDWAVGMATISSVAKWNTDGDVSSNSNSNSTNKILGDSKGEWAYRSDGTLWSHNKQRQKLQQQQQQKPSSDKNETTTTSPSSSILTLILEFHFHDKILLKGVINNQQTTTPVVWFDIPWKNFKKPTAFVPAVTCHNNSVVRFRGWKM